MGRRWSHRSIFSRPPSLDHATSGAAVRRAPPDRPPPGGEAGCAMRSDRIARLSVVVLAAMLVLLIVTLVVVGRMPSAERASTVGWRAQSGGSWFFDEDIVAALAAEAIVFLVSLVGCGVLIAGMETLAIWSEGRERRRAPHPPFVNPQRDTARRSPSVTPAVLHKLRDWREGRGPSGRAMSRKVQSHTRMRSAGTLESP